MLNAKSKAVEPLARDFNSPAGVKTNISVEYKFNLKSSTKSNALDSVSSKPPEVYLATLLIHFHFGFLSCTYSELHNLFQRSRAFFQI